MNKCWECNSSDRTYVLIVHSDQQFLDTQEPVDVALVALEHHLV